MSDKAANQASSEDANLWLTVAVITGAQGIRGQVRARVLLEDPTALADFAQLRWRTGGPAPRVRVTGSNRSGVILALAGVSDRTAAEALKGRELQIRAADLPQLDDSDEFYSRDLIGLTVVDGQGQAFGEVLRVADYGAGDVVEIRCQADGRLLLLPFTRALFPAVDLATGRITCLDPGETLSQDSAGANH